MQGSRRKLHDVDESRDSSSRMTGIAFLLLFFCFPTILFSQNNHILNGSFEDNLLLPGQPSNGDYPTTSDRIYDSVMMNSKSFAGNPPGGNIQIFEYIEYLPLGPTNNMYPQDGAWCIALRSIDSVSLAFENPLIVGKQYKISFYDLCYNSVANGNGGVRLGVSNSPKQFQNLLFSFDSANRTQWTKREIIFTAPIAANHLTVSLYALPTSATYPAFIFIDNFRIECSYPYTSLGNDTTLCSGNSIFLDARQHDTGFAYLWNNGSFDSTYTASTPGWHWVQITNACGVFTDSIYINNDSVPVFTLGSDTAFCTNGTYTLNSGDTTTGKTYLWSTGETTRTIDISTSGTYWLKKSTANGCSYTDTIKVVYSSPPVFDLGVDLKTCFERGQTITLNVGAGTEFLWNTGYNGQHVLATTPGKYWVTVKNEFGCMASDTISLGNECVDIPDSGALYIPNSFTPNEDGRNDTYQVIGRNIQQYQISIFDRWGMKVFESNDLATSWDGTYKGEPVLTNGFLYVIEYSDNLGFTYKRSGEIYLIK